mgnify:CR=1 FL=1
MIPKPITGFARVIDMMRTARYVSALMTAVIVKVIHGFSMMDHLQLERIQNTALNFTVLINLETRKKQRANAFLLTTALLKFTRSMVSPL